MSLYPVCNHYIDDNTSEVLCWNNSDYQIYSSIDCFLNPVLAFTSRFYTLHAAYYGVGYAYKNDVCIFLWSALPVHCKDPKRYFKASGDVLKYGFTREEFEEMRVIRNEGYKE